MGEWSETAFNIFGTTTDAWELIEEWHGCWQNIQITLLQIDSKMSIYIIKYDNRNTGLQSLK